MLLAMDAGGTSTRAVTVDESGQAFGYGRSGSGNPTAVGIASAVAALGAAAGQASPDGGVGPGPAMAVIAMAGQQTGPFVDQVSVRLAELGVSRVLLQPDLLGIFHSGTHQRDGYALISGTGSVAARIQDGRLDRVVGGRGWLLGDAGSGFWMGHQIARAVVSALDGQGPATALTQLVLDALGVEADLNAPEGRVHAVRQLVSVVYAQPPVRLAQLAPLAFVAHEDLVARRLLIAASAALADLVAVVRVPTLSGPVIGGGSVLVRGLLAAPDDLRRELVLPAGDAEVLPVPDGVVGAAVLGLRSEGVDVGARLFRALTTNVARVAELDVTRDPPC